MDVCGVREVWIGGMVFRLDGKRGFCVLDDLKNFGDILIGFNVNYIGRVLI